MTSGSLRNRSQGGQQRPNVFQFRVEDEGDGASNLRAL